MKSRSEREIKEIKTRLSELAHVYDLIAEDATTKEAMEYLEGIKPLIPNIPLDQLADLLRNESFSRIYNYKPYSVYKQMRNQTGHEVFYDKKEDAVHAYNMLFPSPWLIVELIEHTSGKPIAILTHVNHNAT